MEEIRLCKTEKEKEEVRERKLELGVDKADENNSYFELVSNYYSHISI